MTISILCPMSFTTWFDPYNPGAPVQANLYYYHAGSEDLITVYTDSGLAIPHAQPVVTMGSGRVPPVWIGELPEAGYRVRIFDQYSVLLEDVDGLPGAAEAAGGGGGGDASDPTRLLGTGDIIYSFSNNQPREGFVMCNGGSIGSALSAATQRAHANTHDLFVWLWQQDVAGTILTIQPTGRGASADSDWTANKHIATPDLQGRTVVGLDAMGGGLAQNRLAGVPFSLGTQALLGSLGGAALHTLVAAEVPDHTHTLTDPKHVHTGASPDHVHAFSGNTGFQSADHVHSGTTNVENASHQHSYTPPLAAGTVNSGVSFGVATVGNSISTGNDNANHTHSFSTSGASSNHSHAFGGSTGAADRSLAFTTSSVGTGITITGTTGGGGAHNNTPLAMTLCAYMRL